MLFITLYKFSCGFCMSVLFCLFREVWRTRVARILLLYKAYLWECKCWALITYELSEHVCFTRWNTIVLRPTTWSLIRIKGIKRSSQRPVGFGIWIMWHLIMWQVNQTGVVVKWKTESPIAFFSFLAIDITYTIHSLLKMCTNSSSSLSQRLSVARRMAMLSEIFLRYDRPDYRVYWILVLYIFSLKCQLHVDWSLLRRTLFLIKTFCLYL